MNPFLLDKKTYPSYCTIGFCTIWNLDEAASIGKLVEYAADKITIQWHCIRFWRANVPNDQFMAAHFTNVDDRDKAYDDMYTSMVESKTGVRVVEYPS